MRKILPFLLLALILVACSTDGSSFKIDGRLLNLNQGEFYVYSPDGVMEGIDTIFVVAGRFNYKGSCDRKGTLVIVFPNFSEQPVFVEPGRNIKISGDVSHLRELKVSGTTDNKLMNNFREQTKNASMEEMAGHVKQFVGAHAESLTAIYLINKYFIKTATPDYMSACALLDECVAAQPANGLLVENAKKIRERASTAVGETFPPFKVVSISGDTITDKYLSKGDAVVYLWASYDYEACNIQRMLKGGKRGEIHTLGISLDTSLSDCKRMVDKDEIEAPVVCDGRAFDGALVQQLGMSTMPDNIIVKDGKIVARSLSAQELRERFPEVKN